jgi:hypothetical protein
MNSYWASTVVVCALSCLSACSSTDDTGKSTKPTELTSVTVLDLDDVTTNPTDYEFADFRPNIQKLFLAGAAETKHIAILWYTVMDGGVALHYHAKTESVYVIEGSQTDAKSSYPTGTAYFNPPGSGHQVTDSTGFFLLAYAAPPDFASTDMIGEYEPFKLDTTDPELTLSYPFEERQPGVKTFLAPLDSEGGLNAEFIETTSSDTYDFSGNYLLVLDGNCEIEGVTFGKGKLVVTKDVELQAFRVAASTGSKCLTLGVSF